MIRQHGRQGGRAHSLARTFRRFRNIVAWERQAWFSRSLAMRTTYAVRDLEVLPNGRVRPVFALTPIGPMFRGIRLVARIAFAKQYCSLCARGTGWSRKHVCPNRGRDPDVLGRELLRRRLPQAK